MARKKRSLCGVSSGRPDEKKQTRQADNSSSNFVLKGTEKGGARRAVSGFVKAEVAKMRLYLDENDPAGRGYPGMWDGEGVGRLGHVLKGRRWDLVPPGKAGHL